MFEREWLTLSQAAERLGEPEDRVRAIVSERRMDTSTGPAGDLLIDLQDLATYVELGAYDRAIDRGCTESQAAREAEHARDEWLRPAPPPSSDEAIPTQSEPSELSEPSAPPPHRRIESNGNVMITVREACEMLHIKECRVFSLLHEGRLNGLLRGGRRWIYLDEVQFYALAQDRWRDLGGRWTIYGRLPKQIAGTRNDIHPVNPPRNSDDWAGEPIRSGESLTAGVWVTLREAADRLAVTIQRVWALIHQGRLKSVHSPDPPGPILRLHPPARRWRHWVLLDDVLEHADRVDAEKSRSCISPAEWRHDLRHPVVRTDLVAPSGDRLITTREAAAILETDTSHVLKLTRKGLLFRWQEAPGTCGVPVYLSERQVLRYANDPDHIARSAAIRRGLSLRCGLQPDHDKPDDPAPLPEYRIWQQNMNIPSPRVDEPSIRGDADYGEYFTTRQVARLLGVAIATVHQLRRNRRLSAQQRRKARAGAGKSWFFFRKDDVYALLADPDYLREHQQSKAAWERRSGVHPSPAVKERGRG